MNKEKFSVLAVVVAACVICVMSGCERPAGETIIQQTPPAQQLQEVFVPRQATYKVVTESHQSLKYEGVLSDDAKFKGGRNVSKIEMTFTQNNQSVNDKGNFVTKITIDSLKVSSTIKDELVFSFDSGDEKDSTKPMAKLIGKSYTLEMSPASRVVSIINAAEARAAVAGTTDSHRRAQSLLRDDAIKQRHLAADISFAEIAAADVGDSWSNTSSFEFPILGRKTYERIYTLSEFEQDADGRVAVLDMEALPNADTDASGSASLMNMFDNRRTYTGTLKIDVDKQMLKSYSEKLDSEWVFVDPQTDPNSNKAPAAFRMGAVRLYSLERID